MRILFLSYFYEPDLSAGSFRNTALSKKLAEFNEVKEIHVITTHPNRYNSFKIKVEGAEQIGKIRISRVAVPEHQNGFFRQIRSFYTYYKNVRRLTKTEPYHLVYASSSKLFTAFLGSSIAGKKKIPLYLDIRDLFIELISDLLKGKFTTFLIKWILGYFERYSFLEAKHINLVSEGFKPYFEKYPHAKYSYFTNGIDEEFLHVTSKTFTPNDPKIITYAGNIGEGQGLHIFVPAAAKLLEGKVIFNIIGDGGAKKKLEQGIHHLGVKNVQLFNPLQRKELIDIYLKSDFLFLHLNDFDAFRRVLPSKLFEYGAFDKPVIAGVGGYAASFILKNLDNIILFEPGDYNGFVEQYNQYSYLNKDRVQFKRDFQRESIMDRMARSIIETGPNHR